MHIAHDKGAPPNKNFLDYVEWLTKNHYVPPGGQDWVDYVRKRGNEATHEVLIMQEADSHALVSFVELLLRFMYEFPSLVPPSPAAPAVPT